MLHPMFARLRHLPFAVAGLAATACPSQEQIGAGALTVLSEGVINDPRNKSLRFDILKFGLDQFCFEMTSRGAPLKLEDDHPVLGRFFATNCSARVVDDDVRKSFVLQYEGRGYAWTNVSERIGFTSAGLVEYAPDFQVSGDAMYVYFRPKNVEAIDFGMKMVESTVARAGGAALSVDFDAMGRNIVQTQLRRGFTVIRRSAKGETDFALGFIAPGQLPFKPFRVESTDRILLANDRTEVHSGQQDFVGAFTVPDDDQALYLTMTVDGAPAVDVLVVPRGVGDLMIQTFVASAGPAPLNGAPALDDTLVPGSHYKRYVRVPAGSYYLVLDHSGAVGRSAPPAVLGDDRAAKIDYVVQLGDEP